MTYFSHQPILIIPKAKVTAFNAILERQGYGAGNVSVACIGKAQSTNAQPTHYAVEMPADEGLLAAILLAVAEVPGVHYQAGRRGPKKLNDELDKQNLKPKRTRKLSDDRSVLRP